MTVMTPVFLCRFGELFLKSGNRSRFERVLHENMRRMFHGLRGVQVDPVHGRVLVRADDSTAREVHSRLQRVFGLVSFSAAMSVDPDLPLITELAVRTARDALAQTPALGRSFRIEARRSNKSFPLNSLQLSAHIGSQVNIATSVPVDLHNPALVIGVEVGHRHAFVYTGSTPAPGGLPVGTSGRGLLLLSGGIDSPVAGWLSAKRGLGLDGLYFHSPPFVGEKSRDKVISLARELARWHAMRNLYVVNFTDTQKRLREAGPAELAVVLYRRTMMRVADKLAGRIDAHALITGENLGQVASQTVPNMATIQDAARHLILRPLITYDKQETIEIAQRIGTFDVSSLPYDDCCSLFLPAHPATRGRVSEAEKVEAKLDLEAEVQAMVDTAEVIEIGGPISSLGH